MASTLDFKLPENLTIANVQHLHEVLEDIIDRKECDSIVLQAESVERADTAGLQLMLAFVNASKNEHLTLSWKSPSEKLCSAASMLGLEEALGIAS